MEPIYDVIIIGAGPCGLAVASRLCEHTPSALFTDEEHQRYHWIRRHSGQMAILNKRNYKIKPACRSYNQQYKTLVLDSSGDHWLTRWNKLFTLFDIRHLRSPMFFHIDPSDRDALLAFTYKWGRQEECREITGCVGKEKSKHQRKKDRRNNLPREPVIDERDRKDYFTPSRELFADQCKHVANHYWLKNGLIRHEAAQDIQYGGGGNELGDKLITIRTDKNEYRARAVVLAIGPGNPPTIPGIVPSERVRGACHAMQAVCIPDSRTLVKVKQRMQTNVVVVGGGLTSAQISNLAIQRGITKVWHIMRSHLKVKAFDLNLEWLGKFRNAEQAAFWSSDTDEERLATILKARNGGSITPKFHKILKAHEAAGRLTVLTKTVITSRCWNPEAKVWTVTTEPPTDLPPMDYIYYATGISTDVETIPFLQNMFRRHPIKTLGGLPCITDELKWSDQVPLYFTGRLAALQLGPGAANLAGARTGAERIAWSLSDLQSSEENSSNMSENTECYTLGIGNRYSILHRTKPDSL